MFPCTRTQGANRKQRSTSETNPDQNVFNEEPCCCSVWWATLGITLMPIRACVQLSIESQPLFLFGFLGVWCDSRLRCFLHFQHHLTWHNYDRHSHFCFTKFSERDPVWRFEVTEHEKTSRASWWQTLPVTTRCPTPHRNCCHKTCPDQNGDQLHVGDVCWRQQPPELRPQQATHVCTVCIIHRNQNEYLRQTERKQVEGMSTGDGSLLSALHPDQDQKVMFMPGPCRPHHISTWGKQQMPEESAEAAAVLMAYPGVAIIQPFLVHFSPFLHFSPRSILSNRPYSHRGAHHSVSTQF